MFDRGQRQVLRPTGTDLDCGNATVHDASGWKIVPDAIGNAGRILGLVGKRNRRQFRLRPVDREFLEEQVGRRMNRMRPSQSGSGQHQVGTGIDGELVASDWLDAGWLAGNFQWLSAECKWNDVPLVLTKAMRSGGRPEMIRWQMRVAS